MLPKGIIIREYQVYVIWIMNNNLKLSRRTEWRNSVGIMNATNCVKNIKT